MLMDVGDWYLFDEGCYLRIYGCSRPPHIFPHYVTDKMVLLEIAYQNLIDGASHTLSVNKKSVWPPLPLKVGHYFIETAGGAEAQAHALDRFHFSCGNLKRHDPHDVVQKHCTTCKFHYPYTHDAWPDEETFRRAQTLYELIFRMRGSARERKEAAKARQAKEEQEAKIRAEQEARMKAAVDKRHSELKREKRNDKGKDQMDPENEEAAAARLTEIEKIRQEEIAAIQAEEEAAREKEEATLKIKQEAE